MEVVDKRLGDDAREGVSSGVTWFQVRFLRCFDLSEQRLLFRHISWHGKKGMRSFCVQISARFLPARVPLHQVTTYLEALGDHFDNASRARPPNTHPGHRPTQQRQLQEGVGNHSSNRTQPVPHHVGEYPDAQNRPKRLACFAVTEDVGGSKVRVTVLHSIDQPREDDGELFQIEMPYQTDTSIAHTCGENAALKVSHYLFSTKTKARARVEVGGQ